MQTAARNIGAARPYRHEALFYAGDDDFVAQTSRLVRDGVEAGEPTLVVVAAPKIDRLREALGRDAEAVRFADMAEVGANPARIIPAWQEFVQAYGPEVGLRGIGEPISAARTGDELVECQRHEALLNLAFPTAPLWLVCPYDLEALPDDVLDEARRSHPFLVHGGHAEESGSYVHGALVEGVLAPPPEDAAELRIGEGPLDRVRAFVAERAAAAGLDESRRVELVLAGNEIASNSIEHGGGSGVLRIWGLPDRVVCEVRDAGRLDDPVVDRRLPPKDGPRGRGLWIANHVCDLVQVRSLPDGTLVRMHVKR